MKWIKIALPIGILILSYIGMKGIEASAADSVINDKVDTRPTVTLKHLLPEDTTITLSSYGEVQPLESTNIAAQVSGEVQWWNPKFVSGGLVRRGEVLFSIEKDAYEAALILAQANLSSAKAQLIQEQAQAEVARQEAATMPDARVTDLYLRKPQVMSAQAAVKSAEAQLKIAQRDLNNCDVRVPYDALIVSRNIGTGDYITQGTSAGVINNIEQAEIVFPIAGFDSAFMAENTIGSKALVVLDDNNNTQINATIHRDTGIVDSATRMTHLVARIDDPYALHSKKSTIKFGSYAFIKFQGKTLHNVYRVPQELITNNTLWTLDEDNKLQSHSVNVIREDGSDFLIQGNFNANKVVMTLPEYPQNGMEVKVISSNENLVANQASVK